MEHTTPMLQTNPSAVIRKLPHGLAHEVERLTLGFDWVTPLNADTMAKLSALGDQISDLLPRKFEVSTSEAQASLGSFAGLENSSGSELYAVLFDDNQDENAPFNEKHAEVIINTDGLYFSVHHRYDGWEKTRALAYDIYKVLFEAVLKEVPVASIEFRVSNMFYLEAFTGHLRDLLNEGCDSLPRRVFAADGLWHIDEGYYERQPVLDMQHLLVNLNVSRVQEDARETLHVRTMHQYDFDEALSESPSLENLFDRFESLHTINKTLLSTVLNENISRSLGLLSNGVVI